LANYRPPPVIFDENEHDDYDDDDDTDDDDIECTTDMAMSLQPTYIEGVDE
jgi:hypothetical protein